MPVLGVAHGVSRLLSSDSIAVGGHAPGTVLAGRFRIIGLLGRGGMGEVYRADDLKLGQPVALKFLPKALADDPVRRERFHAEVRIARQVSHPNVCRVYDIDEIDGHHFLSMEFIDGEDLSSLLKRIDHLAGTKVLQLARQLCAGLTAAHHRGVLHRDLKPANVMIDGRGVARITDFGLAVAVEHVADDREMSGTPVYMAPEQLAGQSASVQSDLYALGMVLYELSTGRRPFNARTIADLRLQKASGDVVAPSEIVRDVDAAVERVILRCLEPEPALRPASALQVAAALPGGDPLAAALAAGETPSPEMVAASVATDALRPVMAWSLVALLAVFVAVSVWLGQYAVFTRRAPLARPPDALVERARQIVERAGYTYTPADTAFGIAYDAGYLRGPGAGSAVTAEPNRASPEGVMFWYRQSARPLKRWAFGIGMSPKVTWDDPPLAAAGDLLVTLNGTGELRELVAVPPAVLGTPPPTADVDWTPFFRDAALDPAAWREAGALWTPRSASDHRFGWQPVGVPEPDRPARVEAASFEGRPVSFLAVHPWDRLGEPAAPVPEDSSDLASLIGIALTATAMIGGVVVARRNLRLGRGDRRGAWRLVIFVSSLLAVAWLLDEHHVADAHEWYLFSSFLGRALVIGSLVWGTYVAFEPYVRRHWPSTIVSWSRLLGGGLRDPLIGRDILIGCAAGAFVTCLVMLSVLLPSWLDRAAEPLINPTWRAWFGTRSAVSLALQLACNAMLEAFTALFLLVLMRLLLRREWLAIVAATLLLALPDLLLSRDPLLGGAMFVLVYFFGVLLLVRVGLVAVIALRFCTDLLQAYPIVPNLSVWYAGLGLGALMLIAGLVALAMSTALARARV